MNALLLHHNLLANGALTASTTTAGTHVRQITDWRGYTFWRSTNTAAQTITVDCYSPVSADTLALHYHNLASVGASITLEASADNFTADTTVVLGSFAATPGIIFKRFSPITKRYWRLRITGHSAAAQIGIATLGVPLLFDQPIEGEYTPAVDDPQLSVEISQSGHMLGAVVSHTRLTADFQWHYVNDAWFREVFKPVWDAHLSGGVPFFFAPDYTQFPDDVFLYRIDPGFNLNAKLTTTARRQFNLKMIGLK